MICRLTSIHYADFDTNTLYLLLSAKKQQIPVAQSLATIILNQQSEHYSYEQIQITRIQLNHKLHYALYSNVVRLLQRKACLTTGNSITRLLRSKCISLFDKDIARLDFISIYTLVLLLSIGIQILEIPICQKNSHVSQAQDKQ